MTVATAQILVASTKNSSERKETMEGQTMADPHAQRSDLVLPGGADRCGRVWVAPVRRRPRRQRGQLGLRAAARTPPCKVCIRQGHSPAPS